LIKTIDYIQEKIFSNDKINIYDLNNSNNDINNVITKINSLDKLDDLITTIDPSTLFFYNVIKDKVINDNEINSIRTNNLNINTNKPS